MELADLLVYLALFVVPFAAGCAHGMKCDIAEQREAAREGSWGRAA